MALSASVVVVSRDKRLLLERALKALLSQDFPAAGYEVIVIDDGSTDGSREMVESLAALHPNLRYFNQGKRGLAAGRNEGAGLSKGEIVCFTDNDCIADRNWLKEITKPFSDRAVAGVEGRTVAGKKKLLHNAPENLEGEKFVGCNLAFRKSLFRKAGFFDEGMSFWREETDFVFRAMRHGRIVFSRDAVINHPPRRVPLLSILRSLSFIRNDLLLFARFPREYMHFLGFPLGKDMIFASVSWVLSVFLILALAKLDALLFFCLAGCIILLKLLPAVGKEFSWRDLFMAAPLSFLRDLLFPFVLAYYLVGLCLQIAAGKLGIRTG